MIPEEGDGFTWGTHMCSLEGHHAIHQCEDDSQYDEMNNLVRYMEFDENDDTVGWTDWVPAYATGGPIDKDSIPVLLDNGYVIYNSKRTIEIWKKTLEMLKNYA